mmetsp:Transcript_16646/g.36282  ORF Transcript_16646/g.36282 Transcript_16646/m.36282 type:complete len:148 (+) Transcript_16646:22-465(+)
MVLQVAFVIVVAPFSYQVSEIVFQRTIDYSYSSLSLLLHDAPCNASFRSSLLLQTQTTASFCGWCLALSHRDIDPPVSSRALSPWPSPSLSLSVREDADSDDEEQDASWFHSAAADDDMLVSRVCCRVRSCYSIRNVVLRHAVVVLQ